MAACALPSLSAEAQMASTVIVRNPEVSNSFCLMQLSERCGLHQREFRYDVNDIPHPDLRRFHFQWSDEVLKLEDQSKAMKAHNGKLEVRDHQQLDLRKVYDGEI